MPGGLVLEVRRSHIASINAEANHDASNEAFLGGCTSSLSHQARGPRYCVEERVTDA
jgi:hypothetical protein